jgi:glyoxylase-like metal-dependent hydrolase (beta-lactamase superfamily II)
VTDDRWHAGSVRARTARYDAIVPAWTEIGDRVFVRRYAFYDQNIGVVLDGDEVLVIDTRSSHVQGREILADLRELTPGSVTVVVNTHGHFDHAFGNHVFRPASIWGHRDCPTFMASNAEPKKAWVALEVPELASEVAEVVIDPPDRLFAETATIEIGGRRVELRFLGRGHTNHDVVVSVPEANVVFAGDLIEGGAVPYFNDAYPLDWPETAFRLAELVRGTVVPGHGDHAGYAFATDQAVALQAIADLGRRIHRGDLELDDALERTPFPELPREDIRVPLERAVSQLRGELA